MNKSEDEAWALFTLLAENSLLQVQSTRDNPSQTTKKGGLYEVTPTTDLSAKVDSICRQMNQLMTMNFQRESQQSPPPPKVCEICSIEGHVAQECPIAYECPDMGVEHVNAVNPRNDPYSNTFNPGWARHPNFGWKQNEQNGPYGQTSQPQSSYQRGPQQTQSHPPYQAPHQRAPYQGNVQGPQQNRGPYYSQNNGANWQQSNNNQNQNFGTTPKNQDGELRQLVNNQGQQLASHAQSFSKLEMQMSQIADTLSQLSRRGLPSQPIENPKGDDKTTKHVNAITTLRSGKIVDNEVGKDRCGGSKDEDEQNENEPLDTPSRAETSSSRARTSSTPRTSIDRPNKSQNEGDMTKESHCETSNTPESVNVVVSNLI